MGKVIWVWVGKGWVCGGVVVQVEVLGGKVYRVGEVLAGGGGDRSGGARVCTHSATSVTEEVCVAPLSEVYHRVGTQPA